MKGRRGERGSEGSGISRHARSDLRDGLTDHRADTVARGKCLNIKLRNKKSKLTATGILFRPDPPVPLLESVAGCCCIAAAFRMLWKCRVDIGSTELLKS